MDLPELVQIAVWLICYVHPGSAFAALAIRSSGEESKTLAIECHGKAGTTPRQKYCIAPERDTPSAQPRKQKCQKAGQLCTIVHRIGARHTTACPHGSLAPQHEHAYRRPCDTIPIRLHVLYTSDKVVSEGPHWERGKVE